MLEIELGSCTSRRGVEVGDQTVQERAIGMDTLVGVVAAAE